MHPYELHHVGVSHAAEEDTLVAESAANRRSFLRRYVLSDENIVEPLSDAGKAAHGHLVHATPAPGVFGLAGSESLDIAQGVCG